MSVSEEAEVPAPPGWHYRASVRVLLGDRRLCEFMAAAGLGVTGAGAERTYYVDYKPGEAVTRGRVANTFAAMRQAADSSREAFVILAYEVVDLVLVQNKGAKE